MDIHYPNEKAASSSQNCVTSTFIQCLIVSAVSWGKSAFNSVEESQSYQKNCVEATYESNNYSQLHNYHIRDYPLLVNT